ncbi:hypothetical protein ILUMI_13146 [Ignelater luminosus]|uniref:Serpin domain-containing protein n=1 Tax=Ignelater luminosus TaxID=2038154 RepID=A0A8K0G8X1_IGNLU|nr:hypothetical protein ILUMI_13146 [Ignelater luminosus]
MKPFSFLLFVIFCPITFSQFTTLTNELSKSSIKFTSKLYREVAKINSSNFLISPLSLKITLGMITSAARGKTYKEIIRVLHVNNELEIVTLIQNLSSSTFVKDTSLISANKIYISNSFKISSNYLANVKDNFKSQIQLISFTNTKKAVEEMNKWIETKTKKKIKDIVSPDDFDSSTVSVLLNVLYFHDKWLLQFNKENTETLPFYVNPTTSIPVDMMKANISVGTSDDTNLKIRILRLPYANEDIAMHLVISEHIDGIHLLEKNIKEILSTTVDAETIKEVQIPKFAINSSHNLIPVLEKMGMQHAFGKDADFSGMLDPETRLVQINLLKQSTLIEVDEKGTVAAAVTQLQGKYRSNLVYPKFVVDRPFIFYIQYKSEVLFIGRCYSP